MGEFKEGNSQVSAEDLESAKTIIRDWVDKRRDAAWMNENLTEDFRFSTFLLPRLVEKVEFIDIVSNTPAVVSFVSVLAEALGKIIVTRLLVDIVEEDFTADLGVGMPTGKEIQDQIVGHQIVYISGFRRIAGKWKCFDHHQIGVTD